MDVTRKVLLCILDGFGLGKPSAYNAIYQADTPILDQIFKKYPSSKLIAGGEKVGLPADQFGNSEVGHMTIGAGRVIEQDLTIINKFFKNDLQDSAMMQQLIYEHKKSGILNIFTLISDGGVHAHIDHLAKLIDFFGKQNIGVSLHLVTDGRDSSPRSGIDFITKIKNQIAKYESIKIATIAGRFYAMDRDNRWERTEEYYNILLGSGACSNDINQLFEDNYNKNITDEFIKPTVTSDFSGLKNGDSFFMLNFRADRVKQISGALLDQEFTGFLRKQKINFAKIVSLSAGIHPLYQHLISRKESSSTLGEVIARNNLAQLRIAETEKYAHVTYFFNAGKEALLSGEERTLIPSPKIATYDLMPSMSAELLTETLCDKIDQEKFTLIVVNFANADMVGHTGNLQATIKAIACLDNCLEKVLSHVIEHNYTMILTADHGNAEEMYGADMKVLTSHTNNPVPFVIINYNVASLVDGTLADIAPTILSIMELAIPAEMSGRSLLDKK